MASLGSMLLYWYHYAHNGRRIEVETDDDRIGGAFPAPAARQAAVGAHGCGRCTPRSILYAEHEFNASTFTARVDRRHRRGHVFGDHRRASARCAARSMAAPTRSRSRSRSATPTPDEAEADIRRRVAAKEVVIGFGHPVYTIADPRNKVIKEVARQLSRGERQRCACSTIADRIEAVMARGQADVRQSRLVQRGLLPRDGRADGDVHAAVRHLAHLRLVRACHRAARSTTRSSGRRPTMSGRTTAPSSRSKRRDGSPRRCARHEEAR